MEQAPEKTELGLQPRLIAAVWFAATATIPVVGFFMYANIRENPVNWDLPVLVFFGELPTALAFFFGFSVGVRIIDPIRRMSKDFAASLGMIVASLSYLAFMILFLVETQISLTPSNLWWMVIVVTIGSVFFALPVLGCGALCGVLLCLWSCQAEPWEWLLNLPRLTLGQATFLIATVALLVLLNCALAVHSLSTFQR